MAITIQVEQRNRTSKGDLRKLRTEGQIPAVVYGKQLKEAQVISVSEKQIANLLRTHPNAVISLDIPGVGKQSVMITDVQRDALNGHMQHIDFHQINMNERVRTHVRIDVTGESFGVREGGIQQVILHELEIQCLPADIPELISADITNLVIGDSLYVSDLYLPEGIEAKTDADAVVVTILAPQKEEEAEEDEAAAVADTEESTAT